jgi:hypothetical protein
VPRLQPPHERAPNHSSSRRRSLLRSLHCPQRRRQRGGRAPKPDRQLSVCLVRAPTRPPVGYVAPRRRAALQRQPRPLQPPRSSWQHTWRARRQSARVTPSFCLRRPSLTQACQDWQLNAFPDNFADTNSEIARARRNVIKQLSRRVGSTSPTAELEWFGDLAEHTVPSSPAQLQPASTPVLFMENCCWVCNDG